MTEDDYFALNIRLVVVNAVPYRIFFLVIVPVHVVVVRCDGAAMHEDIWLTVNLNVDIQRQAVKIIEYLLTDRLSNVFYILVRDIPAVSVPKSQSMWILWIVFSKPVQGIQHHVFVIAQKHLYVGHAHQQTEYPDTVRVPINDIREYRGCPPAADRSAP